MKRWKKLVILLLFLPPALLLLWIFSAGPVVYICEKFDVSEDSTFLKAAAAFFMPLEPLGESKVIGPAITRYLEWWQGLAEQPQPTEQQKG